MNICFRARLNQEGGRCGFRLAFTSEFLPPLKRGFSRPLFSKTTVQDKGGFNITDNRRLSRVVWPNPPVVQKRDPLSIVPTCLEKRSPCASVRSWVEFFSVIRFHFLARVFRTATYPEICICIWDTYTYMRYYMIWFGYLEKFFVGGCSRFL